MGHAFKICCLFSRELKITFLEAAHAIQAKFERSHAFYRRFHTCTSG